MKLKEMLNGFRYAVSVDVTPDVNTEPVIENNKHDDVPYIIENKVDMSSIENKLDETNKTIEALKEFMKQPNVTQISTAEEDTILGDREIEEVMTTLLKFEKEYFSDIPLSSELVKKFVWNLPMDVYDAHMSVLDYSSPDILDPLMCLYALLTEDPSYTMGVYMQKVKELIDSNIEFITTDANDYYELINSESEEE